MNPTSLHAPTDSVSLVCPRCGLEVDERFYGPCGACRSSLRSQLGGQQRVVDVAAYEPKMNVTPNAVATKE